MLKISRVLYLSIPVLLFAGIFSCGTGLDTGGYVPLLSLPSNLVATWDDSTINLSWYAIEGARYKVYYGTQSGEYFGKGSGNGDSPIVTETNSLALKGLTNGVKYYVVVTTFDSAQESKLSNEVSAIPISRPTGLTAKAAERQIELNWSAVSGAISYKVYWGVSSSLYTKTYVVSNTNYTISSLTRAISHYLTVSAINADGQESGCSNEVIATPLVTPPPPPSGLTVTPTDSQVILAWNAVSNALDYTVHWGTSSGNYEFAQYAPTTSCTVEDLTNGILYYFVVTTRDKDGIESGYSAEVSATPNVELPSPTGLTAIAGSGQISLTWNAVTGAASYRVYWGTSSGSYIFTRYAATNGYTIYPLSPGTYYIVVTASDAAGIESAYSNEVFATPY